jgi:glycosyltransferase involved in cell wall biosynthesis
MVSSKKILLLVTLPPPIHGLNIMNKHVTNSNELKRRYETQLFPLRYASSIEDLQTIRIGKIIKFFYFFLKLTIKLIFFRPDFVYFVPSITSISFFRDCIFVFLIKCFKAKIIFHLHMKGIKRKIQNPLLKRLFKWFFEDQYIILLSPLLYPDIQEVAKQKQISYLPNCADINIDTNCMPDNQKRNKQPIRILFFSNLLPTKGPLDLIKACKILKENGFEFKARFAGSPSKQLNLSGFNKIVMKYGLENCVEYIGAKYGKEKIEVFQNSDIFVFPTYFDQENFPIVIVEAIAFGLPVISTNEGAIPEIIDDGINGFLVPKRSPHAIADKIAFFLQNGDKIIQMGQEAKKKYKEYYTIDKFNSKFVETIDRIVGQANC